MGPKTNLEELKTYFNEQFKELESHFEEKLDEKLDRLEEHINKKSDELQISISAVDKKAQEALIQAKKNKEETQKLQNTINQQNITILEQEEKLTELQAEIDAQVNRSLRSTLIFKNLKQHSNEKSWEDTLLL